MVNVNAFVQTNKALQKGVVTPNDEIQKLIERLKNL
jgi:hypothetical protein